ncbi:MAG: flagellar hook-associated protein FlgK [Methylococcales bacterium]
MAGGILGVATSGLMAYQRALQTTSHNIANVDTKGYNRQRVGQTAQDPQLLRGSYIGTGVKGDNVERVYDQFLDEQVRHHSSTHSELESYAKFATEIDNFIADESTGLTGTLQNFFNAAQEVADDPTSVPSRQVLLSEANLLTDRFNTLHTRLADLQGQVGQGLTSTISDVNNFASEIAGLNNRIIVATGSSGGQPPNDLLDQRDQLVSELAKTVDVKTLPQEDGALNVFIGTGQALVMGTTVSKMGTQPSAGDPEKLDITLTVGTSTMNVTSTITGGELAGMMKFRDQILTPTRSALDDIAVQLANDFNTQHRVGWDLDGNTNADFFKVPPVSSDGFAGAIKVEITDTREIAASAVDTSSGAVGNNGNALKLAELQVANNMLGNTASYHDAYGVITSDIGSKTHAAKVNEAAQKGLLDYSREAKESLSGVNLDEEAANLIKFQQAYQASAQVISAANSLFDTLLSAVRR